MSRFYSLIIALTLTIALAGCKSQPSSPAGSKTSPPKAGQPSDSDQSDELSLPIDSKEMNELTEPDASHNTEAQRELTFLRRFKIAQSLDEVRKSIPTDMKLGSPTTDLPDGELPEDQLVVEFKGGDLSGFFYFEGTPQEVGKLAMVEVFTDDRSYKNGKGKQRIRTFVSLLGKPTKIRKEEDDDGSPLYEAVWRENNQLIRYADVYEWGSTLSLSATD
jgi:hypothetical protein